MVHQNTAGTTDNCFTISRFADPVRGIVVSEQKGPNLSRAWEPFVSAGTARIHQDRSRGCVLVSVGNTKVVYQARVRTYVTEMGRTIHTLKEPPFGDQNDLLLKMYLGFQDKGSQMKIGDRNIKVFMGAVGGTLLERDATEAVVKLAPGQHVTCFFVDGTVRIFGNKNATLTEYPLSQERMFGLRIAQANTDLDQVNLLPAGEARDKKQYAILMGMTDLLRLTTSFGTQALGQELRLAIMRDFFRLLELDVLSLVHRRVVGILHEIDPVLLVLLRQEAAESVATSPKVVDLGARRALRDKVKLQKSQRDREVRAAMKGRAGQRSAVSSKKKQ